MAIHVNCYCDNCKRERENGAARLLWEMRRIINRETGLTAWSDVCRLATLVASLNNFRDDFGS